MTYEEFKKTMFGEDYCNREVYVVEGFFANPHKYSDIERDKLSEHIIHCKRCATVFLEEEERQAAYNRTMRH